MSALAVSTSQAPPPPSTFDDPFESLNSIGTKSADDLPSVSRGTGDLKSFVEHVSPAATQSWRDHDLRQGMFEAQANPLQTGWNAAHEGEASMRQWARFQLGVVKGAPLPAEVKLFKDGGFARGLANRWNTLIDKTMTGLPPQARKAYERILNEEMRQAMQLAMLHDAALDEYAPIKVREFSAQGRGKEHEIKLSEATIARTKELQQQDAAQQQHMQQAAQADGALRQKFGFDGANALALATQTQERQDAYTRVELARPAVEFRIDAASISRYQNAKFVAAVEYSQKFAEVARGGIVAIAMGKQYASEWLAGELGFVQGQQFQGLKDGKDAPNSRALAQRWEKLSNETLMAMPEFLREKYAPLANQTVQRGVHFTMHMDAQIGKYASVNLRDFTPGGPGDEFKYFLNEDGSLGREAIKEDGNCIEQIILPIINVALYFIPVVGVALGSAMTVAMSVKNGIETGNWLGAGIGIAAGMVGMGGAVAGMMGGATAAAGSTLGTVNSAFTTAGNVMKVAQGAYGLASGIESGNVLGAVGGGLSMVGSMARFGVNDTFGEVNGSQSLVDGSISDVKVPLQLNPSILPTEFQHVTKYASDGLSLYQAVESDNPWRIGAGAAQLLQDGADRTDSGAAQVATRVVNTGANIGSAFTSGNGSSLALNTVGGIDLLDRLDGKKDTPDNFKEATEESAKATLAASYVWNPDLAAFSRKLFA